MLANTDLNTVKYPINSPSRIYWCRGFAAGWFADFFLSEILIPSDAHYSIISHWNLSLWKKEPLSCILHNDLMGSMYIFAHSSMHWEQTNVRVSGDILKYRIVCFFKGFFAVHIYYWAINLVDQEFSFYALN